MLYGPHARQLRPAPPRPADDRPPGARGVKVFEILKQLGRPFDHVLQVGAHAGEEIELFRRYDVKRAIMIEAAEEPYARLCANVGEDPRFVPVKALCASLDGVAQDFFVASASMASSMLAPERVLTEHPKIKFGEPVRMTGRTLDRIVEELEQTLPGFAAPDLDLIYMDTQGAELKVLMGANRVLHFVDSIWAEVSGDLYREGATLEGLQGFLRPYGFRLNNIYINTHGWGDALFVRDQRSS